MSLAAIRPADAVMIAFVLLFASLVMIYNDSVVDSGRLLATYLGILFLQLALTALSRRPSNPGGRSGVKEAVLRSFHDIVFPVVAILLVYDTMTELIRGVNPRDIDHLLIRIDYWLLGVYPTVWLERIVNPYLTELLQLSYTSYYFLPLILGVVLKRKGRDAEFNEGLTHIVLCFYLSYVGYILFPALGPRYTMAHLQSVQLQGVALFEGIYDLLNSIEGIKRDAFPSGHTAVTLVVVHLSHRYERRLFRIFLPLAVLLLFSTVYCRYHYVVDVLGGVVLYGITMVSGGWLTKRWTNA